VATDQREGRHDRGDFRKLHLPNFQGNGRSNRGTTDEKPVVVHGARGAPPSEKTCASKREQKQKKRGGEREEMMPFGHRKSAVRKNGGCKTRWEFSRPANTG